MKNEFVPYNIALAMKELGFDEGCFGYYYIGAEGSIGLSHQIEGNGFQIWTNSLLKTLDPNTSNITAPLYQQAFRWFREKYKQSHIWIMDELLDEGEYTHDEAELACIRELIEIIKEKNE